MPLTLQGPPQHAVYQRRAGTTARDVPVRFAFTGTPGTVQARVVRASGGAVVKDWTNLTGQTLASGTGYGLLPGVPQGDGYRLDVREGTGGATVQGTTTWGVGAVVFFAGQSNMMGTLYGGFWGNNEFDLYNPLFRAFDDAGWGLSRRVEGSGGVDGRDHIFSMGRLYIGRQALAALGNTVPVGWVEMCSPGTAIEAFLPGAEHWQRVVAPSGPGLGAGGTAAGLGTPDFGDFEAFVWHQGESDSDDTTAQYKAALQTLVDGLLGVVAPYGRTASTLNVGLSIVEGLNPHDFNLRHERIRRAVVEFVAEGRAAGKAYDIASSTVDLWSDGLHFGGADQGRAEAQRNGRRYAQYLRRVLTGTGHGARGPAIASVQRQGNDFIVTVAHDGGTTLRTQGAGAPTGFVISHDGFVADKRLPASVAITGPNTIRVTGSGMPAAASLKYQGAIPGNVTALSSNDLPEHQGVWWNNTAGPFDGSAYPDIRRPVYDNAALPPDWQGNPVPDTVTGLPLLPLLAAVNLADGATWTAPAGYTTASGGTGTGTGTDTGTGSGRTAYAMLTKAGGPSLRAGTGKGAMLTASPSGGTGTGTGTGGTGTGGTGTGGTGTGGTGTYTGTLEALRLTAATPTLPVALRVHAEEAYAQPPVHTGLAFGPGDVPSTHRVRLRTAGGTEIAVQQDNETRWPDGSLKFCTAAFVAPDTFSAGQTIPYTVDAVAGAPNRTAGYTLAQVAANSNFTVQIRGHSLGSAVGVLSVNELIAANKVNSWGVNPKSGIEVIASGPICQEWKFWTVAKRQSDGAYHESIKLELYLRRWAATGAWEMVARQRQPSFDAAFYGSTWTTSGWRNGNANYVECFNGTTRLWAIGGPNDRDARTVPASAFNASAGTYTIPAGQNLGQVGGIGDRSSNAWTGLGVPFGVAGNIPGGMNALGCYWWDWSGRILYERNNGGAVVSFTAPAGNVQVFPLIATFPGTGVPCADEQGDPFWAGSGARPRVRVGHDEAYLTRTSRLFAPLDLALPRPAQPVVDANWPYHPYRPCQLLGQQWIDWGLEGDDWDKDRVGWLSRQHANLLLTPFDKVRRTHCYALAYMQNDAHFDWEDQRSGRIIVGNNGPNDNGTTYPEMGPVMPTIYMSQRDSQGANSASPGFNAMANYNKGGSGYTVRYDNLGEASHYPSWQSVPYLLTGHRVFLDIMRTNTALMSISHDAGKRQSRLGPPYLPATRKFYNVFFDQGRSQGWMRLAWSNLRHVLPDGHPERPYLDDVADQQATYWGAIAPHSPWRMYGNVPICPPDGNLSDAAYRAHAEYMTSDQNIGFHNIFETFGTLICLWRGEAKYKPAVQVYLNYLQHAADDQLYPEGNGYFSGHYFTYFREPGPNGDMKGAYYTSRAAWIRGDTLNGPFSPHIAEPYPNNANWGGNFHHFNDPKVDPGPGAFGSAYSVQHCAALGFAAWLANPDGSAMFPDTARVRLQLLNRVIAHPDGVPATRVRFPLSSNSQPNEMVVQWSVVPPGV